MRRTDGSDLAQIRWTGSKGSRSGRVAVVSLEGGSSTDLAGALALARQHGRRPFLIAVDGGVKAFRGLRRRPDLFVGDLDSTRVPPVGVASRIFPKEKSFSDFSAALVEAEIEGISVAVVAGLLGGRLDHEWANVLEVGASASRFEGILAPSKRGLVAITAHGLTARTGAGRIVSLFGLSSATRVSLSGARWTLKNRALPPGSLGLSNVTEGPLTLRVHRGVAALVFPREGA